MEVQNQKQTDLAVFKKSFLSVMQTGDRFEISSRLALFKINGQLNYDAILRIPSGERIPVITADSEGRSKVVAALSASIISAFGSLNLRNAMTDDQILDLAEEIIDSAKEDNLALEDVLLFLKDMITGKCGVINDRMDIPTFFKLFEVYRQERHQQNLRITEEMHSQFKSGGPTERVSDTNRDSEKNAFHEAMKTYYKPAE